jgi:hypothetical protein
MAAVAQIQGQWQVHDKADQMSGARMLSVTIVQDIESNDRHGNLDLTAKCLSDGAVTLNFVYRSKVREGAGFYLKNGSQGPFTFIRSRIDGAEVVTTPAGSDYPNQAALDFIVGERSTDLPGMPAARYFREVGSVGSLFGAQRIKFEFTLDNGDTPMLEIHPQDPGFRQFATACANKDAAPQSSGAITSGKISESMFTAAEFVALLPDALRKAAVDRGLDLHAYDKELQFVSDAIKTCAQITPQMATDPARPERDAAVWSKYGKQYGICTTITSVDASVEAGNPHGSSADPNRPRTNDVMIRIGQPVGQHYKDGKGFEVSISVLYDKTPLFDSVNIGQDSQPRP